MVRSTLKNPRKRAPGWAREGRREPSRRIDVWSRSVRHEGLVSPLAAPSTSHGLDFVLRAVPQAWQALPVTLAARLFCYRPERDVPRGALLRSAAPPAPTAWGE